MKFLLAVALVGFVAAVAYGEDLKLSEEQKKVVRENAAACIAKEGTTKEAAMELRKGNFANADQPLKCFANCFLEKGGFLVNGAVQEEVVKAKLGPLVGEDQLKTIMDKCNHITGADNCEKAFKIYECYYQNKAAV